MPGTAHVAALALALAATPIAATQADTGGIDVSLTAAAANPPSAQMGDRIAFASEIRNAGPTTADGLVAWLSLVRVDKGHEAPVDLEDWSANKAVALPPLAPGQRVRSEWPVRLIAAGRYRAVVSVAARSAPGSRPARSPTSPSARSPSSRAAGSCRSPCSCPSDSPGCSRGEAGATSRPGVHERMVIARLGGGKRPRRMILATKPKGGR